MEEIIKILNKFKSIGLDEMDGISLMDRTESKYLFHSEQLADFLNQLSNHYRIMEIDNERCFPYSTTYLDTPDFDFFYQHINRKQSRFKVRYRTYESSGDSYLELKHRIHKRRTVKCRIPNKLTGIGPNQSAVQFLKSHINGMAERLKPVFLSRFLRITLACLETGERITIDHHLSFSTSGEVPLQLPWLAIVEVKSARISNSSPVSLILKQMNIRKTHFSKYCVGVSMLKPMTKTNLLKPYFLLLNKIKTNHTAAIIS